MPKKKAAEAARPVAEVTNEEMLTRIDAAIRDKRTNPSQLLRLKSRRDRIVKEMARQQQPNQGDGQQPASSVLSELTRAQQRVLSTSKGDEREMWERVYRSENEWPATPHTEPDLNPAFAPAIQALKAGKATQDEAKNLIRKEHRRILAEGGFERTALADQAVEAFRRVTEISGAPGQPIPIGPSADELARLRDLRLKHATDIEELPR